jgi:transcriptional regulator with XRE-family HTH domain
MKEPNAALYHNPDPEYLKKVIARAGISQREAARRIGVSERVMRQYLAFRDSSTALEAPYPVQFTLENLPPFFPDDD